MICCITGVLCDPATDEPVFVGINPATSIALYRMANGLPRAGDPTTLTACAGGGSVSSFSNVDNDDNTSTVTHDNGAGGTPVAVTYINDLLVNSGGFGNSRSIVPGSDVLQTEEQPHDPAGWPIFPGDLCDLEEQEPVFKSAVDGKYYTRKVFDPFCESESGLITINNISSNINDLAPLQGQGFVEWLDVTAETGIAGFAIPATDCTTYLVEAFIQVVGFAVDVEGDPVNDPTPDVFATIDMECDGDRVYVSQFGEGPGVIGYTGGDRYNGVLSATFKKCFKIQPGDSYLPDIVSRIAVGNSTDPTYTITPVSTNGRINITYTAIPCRG